MLEIAEIINVPLWELLPVIQRLRARKLLKTVSTNFFFEEVDNWDHWDNCVELSAQGHCFINTSI